MSKFWSEEGTKLRNEFSLEFAHYAAEHADEILAGGSEEWIAKIIDHLRISKGKKVIEDCVRGEK